MARRRISRSKATSLPSTPRLLQITSAFNSAASGLPPISPPKPAKRRRKNVLSDDEEAEDEEMEMVAIVDDVGGSGGGGFVQEAGGFLVEDGGDQVMAGQSGENGEGGGFLVEEEEEPFRLDDSEPQAGGFILDDTEPSAGGFILDDATFDESLLEPLPPFQFDDSAPAPPQIAPTATRIPLKSIPEALISLNLPSDSHDLLSLFADVASDDEEGVLSVSRERFVEACNVLLGSDTEGEQIGSEEEEEEEEKEESGESDAYVEEDAPMRRIPTRSRATRANPGPTSLDKGKGKAIVVGELVLSSSEEESAVDSDNEGGGTSGRSSKSKAKKGTTPKGKGKGKGKGKKERKGRVLNEEELKEAEDSYELFFEGSSRAGKKGRSIGLGELKNVAALLNEKLSDEDLLEMLEYAGRNGGVVDLAAFTNLLAEAL
ncbi:hypothetical protein P7C70_g7788, partial [Phenoliferia sp. Uapishka_3]